MKRNKNLFIILAFILLQFIKCETDCSNCKIENKECKDCENNCHWFKIDANTEKCMICDDKEGEESKYYSKKTTIEGENYCYKIGKTGIYPGKKIYGTNQIVNDCALLGYYKLGDICYEQCPENSQDINKDKNCICNNLYYKTIEDNLNIINCIDECPGEYPFYDKSTKECLRKCPIGKSYLGKSSTINTLECRASCQNKKYINKLPTGETITYCVDTCPDEIKYFYDDNICIDKCNKNPQDIININNKCINLSNIKTDDCGTQFYIIIDPEEKNYACKSGIVCPEEYPFKFTKNNKVYCLRRCEDTNISFLNNIKTFSNMKKKQCLEITKENNETYYIIEEDMRYVENCYDDVKGLYHDGRKCVINCRTKYLVDETNECVEECDTKKYFIDEETKMCVKECPSNLGRGFYFESTKKCTSCLIKPSEEDEENDKYGFHKEDDKICYSKCPEGFNHIYKNNICFQEDCKDTDYKFISNDNDFANICFYNCYDIEKDNTKYLIEIDNICYKELPDSYSNYYYYEIKNNNNEIIKKYLPPDKAIIECFKRELKYISNSKCVKECDNYKVLPDKKQFGLCFQDKDKCIENNYKFYNHNKKECSRTCKYYTIEDETGENEVGEGNCIVSCPSNDNESYNKIDGKICKSDCFYEIIDGKNICVESCTKEDNGIIYYTYYNENHQCFDSCSEITDYTLYYYNKDKNICLKNCDKYYRTENNINYCVDNCNDNEYIFPGGKCIENGSCPPEAPFYKELTITLNNDESIIVKQCVSNCLENEEYSHFFSTDKKCLKNEDLPVNQDYVIYYNGVYSTCPVNIDDDHENNCLIKPTDCSKYFEINSNNFNCLDTCGENIEQNNKYITSLGECVSKCPIGEHFISENNNNCISKCENYYELFETINQEYSIYKCVNKCTGNNHLHKFKEKECISSCGNLYEYKGICYSNYDLSTNEIICETECDEDYEDNKICVNDCSQLPIKRITKGKTCVSKCTSSDGYLQIMDNKLYCVEACEESKKRFYEDNYNTCLSKCKNFVKYNSNTCIKECVNKKYIINNDNDEKICLETNECPQDFPYYYEDEPSLCLSECNFGDYIEENTDENVKIYKCIKKCEIDSKKIYDYEPNLTDNTYKGDACVSECSNTNKKITRENNHCDVECDTNPSGDYFHDETQNDYYTCKKQCDNSDGSKQKMYGNVCKNSCQNENSQNIYEDANNQCIKSCQYSINGNIYYIGDSNNCICQNQCLNYLIENNKCINPSETSYKLNNQIVKSCPKSSIFFNNENNCLDKCSNENSENPNYYSITEDKMYKCENVGSTGCKAYVSISSENSLCLGDKCSEIYPFYISNDSKHQCYRKCPDNYYYINSNNESLDELICYDTNNKCPEEYIPFLDSTKCIQKSKCGYIYKTKTNESCVPNCSENQIIYIDGTQFYCLDKCNDFNSNLILSRDNKCVTGCPTNEKVYPENADENTDEKICDCENLFYIEKSTGLKICLDKNKSTCEGNLDYPYLIEENKCNDTCDGVISLNGLKCYNSEEKCEDNTEVITLENGLKQCFCKNKYYYRTSQKKDIICLNEDGECSESFKRNLLIKETKECVEYCPFEKYTKKYENTCLSSCPEFSNEKKGECFCNDKFYIENNEKICVDSCPNSKPIIVEETRECVSLCPDTYPVYYNNRCILNCDEMSEMDLIDLTDEDNINTNYNGYNLIETYKNKANKICYCKGVWYQDEEDNIKGCNSEEQNSCNVFKNYGSYNYLILPMKRCVISCPNEYPYYFNDNCFSSCEEGNENREDGQKIITSTESDSKECVCEGYWKYDENYKKVCVIKNEKEICLEEGYLLIVDTNECYKSKECKEGYYFFNNRCYASNKCPGYSEYISDFPKNCTCPNLWYNNENNDIECLQKNKEECPDNYPNLIVSKKLCVKDNDSSLTEKYKYNRNYYDLGCPLGTYDKENNKICVCNPLSGFWYTTDLGFLICSLSRCPTGMNFTDEKTRECFTECPYFSYNGICYEKCPDLTKQSEDNSKICEISPQIETTNLTKFTEIINENIVDLYKTAITDEEVSGVIEVKGSDSIVEFYGVNPKKKDKKSEHNKNKITSTLSYIDLSECLQSIYETNNMDSNDDIIILKFDMINTPKEYLINPVEYKFINSRTGSELDASSCGNKQIKISYSFFNILSNYDKLTKKIRYIRNLDTIMLDIKSNDLTTLNEKYNLGKEINEMYPNIDTFNSKNEIYTDFCATIEINGKDLVLEDRINYLFPHYSLCEQNCTYNHTDFEEERVYCDCSLKTEFDVNREHNSNVEINENAITLSQEGKSNFPVLKCLSVWKDSNRIKTNIAFYYNLIIIIIEAYLLIMTIIFGINSLQIYFSTKISNTNNTNNLNENIDIEIGDKNINNHNKNNINNEYIKTTERNLNNPPKRENSENNDNDGNNGNEIEFIPEEFVFIYFNDKDKGVRKTIERNLLPFDVKKNTKILLQKIEGVDYSGLKACGPFNEDQNLLEIIGDEDEKNKVGLNIESINESLFNDNNNLDKNDKNKTNEKELITIKEKESIDQEKIYTRKDIKNYIINDNDEIVEDKENKDNNLSFLEKMKIEQRLLRKDFDISESKQYYGFFILMLVEILDKIYITKIILFMQRYDIVYLHLSVYVLHHVFLLNLLAMFFDIKTIQNIWNKENYPGFGLYLGYGLAACLVCWIIYILFICLLTNKGKYNEILNIKKSKKKQNKKLIEKKYKSLISKNKIKIIVYSIIQFILIILFFIYLVTLCAVYHGTMNRIFSSYGIALLEIIIIKILYGLALAILRQYSINNQKKGIYNIVLFMDNYIV